jgi:predicted metal-binding protein
MQIIQMEMNEKNVRTELADLIQLACRLGAGEAAVILAEDISVEEDLARLCQDPPCESYGLSAGCPPHVAGPSRFRELLKDFGRAVVFKIDVPSEILFSSERGEVFELLHEIASGVEQAAARMGYRHSRGFAGGSCKRIFCKDHPRCRVLSEGGECRHADRARPSMSGFGVNVSRLMRVAGWTLHRSSPEAMGGEASQGTVCGLVLIG